MIGGRSNWVIVATTLVALVIYVVPIPLEWRWYRPEWPILVLFYWSLSLPHRVGILSAAITGFAIDMLDGTTFGALALGMVVSTLFILLNYQRIRQFDLLQQSAIMTLLVALALVIERWLQNLLGVGGTELKFLYSLPFTALMWPLVREVLRGLRRYYEVN